MLKILEKIDQIVVLILVFLLPLFVLPVFADQFGLPKIAFLFYGICLIVFIKALKMVARGKIEIAVGRLDLGILAIAMVYAASGILTTPNKMEAFWLPGSATIVIAGALLYFVINQARGRTGSVVITLVISGLAFSVVNLLGMAGVFAKGFNTLGSSLSAGMFIGAIIPLAVGLVIAQKDFVKRMFFGVASIVLVFGLAVSIYNLLPGLPAQAGKPGNAALPGFGTSWMVLFDTIKTSPILGVGPGNYLTAFNRFRPVTYNGTAFWDTRFTTASDFYLTMITETGILGLAALVVIAVLIANRLRTTAKTDKFSLVSLGVMLLLVAVFPAIPVILVFLFILLALNTTTHQFSLDLAGRDTHGFAAKIPAIVAIIPVVAILIALNYYFARIVLAEVYFKKSLDLIVANKGGDSYQELQKTVNTNSYVDRYHMMYAQINIALARAIANQVASNPSKAEVKPTDAQKNNISQLVNQAIREAKAVVVLNPTRSGNWEFLANVYKAITPFAQGADKFALEAFSQAVALDPINPNLRIALGGMLYAKGDFDEAVDAFKLAVYAKQDLPNAHYNLALAYREKGEIEKAISEINSVLSLVKKDSQDYKTASAELENLKKKSSSAKASAGQGETLQEPQKNEKPVINPTLPLPEDASPPATSR